MNLYKVEGRYIIEELQAPCSLAKAIQLAHEHTSAWAKHRQVVMQYATECHPVEYVFSCVCDATDEEKGMGVIRKKGELHEICRIVQHSPYIGTAITPDGKVNEEFEKATQWPDGGKGYDLTKKGNAQYVSRDTQLAWQHWLSGWRKAEQIL